MKKNFTVLIEKDEEGWYVSNVVELPGCHTQGKTIDQLLQRTKEAIHLYLESAEEKEASPEFVCVRNVEVEI